MNPFFFGRAPKSLFGLYHPPKAKEARQAGVVLCYPFGQEYMRAHRAFRQMAMLLSKAGFHVLRFDYSGTGDSSGEGTDGTLADWVHDAEEAADELKETAEVSLVSFVGLRLGATIAALAAAGRSDIDQVVLWDPAVRGRDYLAEILEERTDSVGHSRTSRSASGVIGTAGFPVAEQLQSELRALDLLAVGPPKGPTGRLVIASHQREEYQELGRLQLEGVRLASKLVPSDGDWNEVDDYGGVLIPVLLIQAIVGYLAEESR